MLAKILLTAVGAYFLLKKSDLAQKAELDFSGFNLFMNFVNESISGINDKYDSLFVKYGQRYGVDPKIVKAISANESQVGNIMGTMTVNGRTTGGLMHIELPTAQDYEPNITAKELLIPDNEIRIGTMHIRKLLDRYNGNIELVTRAYNGGMGRVQEFLNGSVSSTWERNTTEYYNRYKRNFERLG